MKFMHITFIHMFIEDRKGIHVGIQKEEEKELLWR